MHKAHTERTMRHTRASLAGALLGVLFAAGAAAQQETPRYSYGEESRNALRLLGAPDDGSVSLTSVVQKSLADTAALAAERDRLQAELAEGRQLWSHAGEMDEANRKLAQELQSLKNQIDVLTTEKERLRDDNWKKWFINGVWATGMGGVLTLLLPRLLARRRRWSEWS